MTKRSKKYFRDRFHRKKFEKLMAVDFADNDADCWLCHCGNHIEDGMHCDVCGAEPPWGCPGECCQSKGWDDEEEEDFPYGSLDY